MRPITLVRLSLTVAALGAAARSSEARAPYPEVGEIYFAFDATGVTRSIQVSPDDEFDLYLISDVPARYCLLGYEGSFHIPAGLEFVEMVWAPGAHDVGRILSTEIERTFIVGLGSCKDSSGGKSYGRARLKVVAPLGETVLTVDAPGIGATPISSFAGIGPGWADYDDVLYLFSTSSEQTAAVLNRTVATEGHSISRLKALYR